MTRTLSSALVVAVVAPLLYVAGPSSAHTLPPSASTSADAASRGLLRAVSGPRTVLHIRTKCAACEFRLANVGLPSVDTDWNPPRKVVGDDHRVKFSIPRDLTRQLAIFVMNPNWSAMDAEPVVALRLPGHKVGSRATNAQFLSAESASGCWAGTNRAHVRMTVKVRKYPGINWDGSSGYGFRAWTRRTQPWLKPMIWKPSETFATQDSYTICAR